MQQGSPADAITIGIALVAFLGQSIGSNGSDDDVSRGDPGKGECGHGDLVERPTLTVFGNDDPTLLIRVLGPIAAQTVPVDSVSINRTEDESTFHIVLVVRAQRDVAETIARKIGRLVDVVRVTIRPGD